MTSIVDEQCNISIKNGCCQTVLQWMIWALRHFPRSLQLAAVLIQKCTVFCTTFSIMSQSNYYTIFVCVFRASSAFVVMWVDRQGQQMQVAARNLYECVAWAEEVTMHACLTETLPTVIPGKPCMAPCGKTGVWMVNLAWIEKLDILTPYLLTLYSSKLKSDWKSQYGMQTTKQGINVDWILNCLSDVCCVANVFPWFSFPLLFFSNFLCSWLEVFIKEIVKGKIQHFIKMSSYLSCGSTLASCTHTYICASLLP